MRIAYLLLLVPALISSGCAGAIARAGTDPTEFKTKEEVHAKFGEPCAIGVIDGAFYEDFTTHRKLASSPPWFEGGIISFTMTLGTIELFLLSQELYHTAKGTITGQTLRYTYDSLGNVIKLQLEGNATEFKEFNTQHKDASDGVPVSARAKEYLPSIPPLPDRGKN